MKIRESGMPEEKVWSTFFNAEWILNRLEFDDPRADVVEFGCGFGIFTLAAATHTHGTVFAFDIEPETVQATHRKALEKGLSNVRVIQRDFAALSLRVSWTQVWILNKLTPVRGIPTRGCLKSISFMRAMEPPTMSIKSRLIHPNTNGSLPYNLR